MSTRPAVRVVSLVALSMAAFVFLVVFSYSLWRTRRRPSQLFHLTSAAAAASIVIAWWPLPSRCPRRRRLYFFARRPVRFGA